MRERLRRADLRRAAPALPNGFTLGSLFFGIYAIVSSSRGDFSHAVLYIVLAGVCDALDGRVARATGTGSQLGEELDSLVDAISFGLAPAMIVYFAVLDQRGWAWLPVFFFAACAVLRLARFNITQAGESKSYFIGLPSPAAGGTLATYYWFSQTRLYTETRIVDLPWQEVMSGLMLLLAFMMISPVPYPVWPKVGLRSKRGLGGLLLMLVIVTGVLFFAKQFLFLFGVSYVLFGIVRWILFLILERAPDEGEELDELEPVRPLPRTSIPRGMATIPAIEQDDGDIDFVPPTASLNEGPSVRRRRKRRRPRGGGGGGGGSAGGAAGSGGGGGLPPAAPGRPPEEKPGQ
jgi:CDP-diacylglycerol--serine O-phosphatidyltransferase